VVAALALAPRLAASPGLVLVITAGEETGCQGAQYLAGLGGALGPAGAIVIAEPTDNYPLVGHKGAMWLAARAAGVTAHASMPEQGVNAIYKAARAVTRLESFRFGVDAHPVLGGPTLTVGTFHGGLNANSVPDAAEFSLDVRTIPALLPHAALARALAACAGDEVALEPVRDVLPMWSDPDDPWVQHVFDVTAPFLDGRPRPRAAPYATDGSVLSVAYRAPAVILGPGAAAQAHQTDECCRLDRIDQAVELYTELARHWCRL
jgi:succinyl-diaminopimelate desuccinylase